jgi:molybdopterin synthase sulfur carrier subunit
MADVILPRNLVELFPGAPRRLTIEAATVAELIRELDRRWPGMWDRLCEAGPAIRFHLNIFVNGDKSALSTPLAPASRVQIIPAITGG